ncbi:MAG: hypothetical protein U9Q81_12560 [Pseudomonadota bacterium]|nr:hypothetical protein [Pseudomonadota bacterium]
MRRAIATGLSTILAATLLFVSMEPPALAETRDTPSEKEEASAPTRKEPGLRLVGASEEGYSFKTTTKTFRQQILVEAINDLPVKDVDIRTTLFKGPDGKEVHTRWTINERSFYGAQQAPGLGSMRLGFSASFVEPGTYRSTLTLIYGGRRESKLVIVQRTVEETPVTITPAGATLVTSYLSWAQDAGLWVTLQNDGGSKLSLVEPVLGSLTRKLSDDTKIAADFAAYRLTDSEGKPFYWPYQLAAYRPVGMRLNVEGLTVPGRYEGTLTVEAEEHRGKSAQVTILVRAGWMVAALLIFFGVIASFLLRLYRSGVRERLVSQREALQLKEKLTQQRTSLALRDGTEAQVFDALTTRLDEILTDLQFRDVSDADASIDAVRSHVPLVKDWIDLHRWLDGIEGADDMEAFKKELDVVRTYVIGTWTEEQRKEHAETLRTMEDRVRKQAQSKALAEDLQTLNKQVKEWAGAVTIETVQAAITSEVTAKLEAAQTLLDKADVDGARTAAEDARLGLARILSRDLLGAVAGDAPLGTPDDAWKGLGKTVPEALRPVDQITDAGEAMNAYNRALAAYTATVSGGLREKARTAVVKFTSLRKAKEDIKDDQEVNMTVSRLQSRLETLPDEGAKLAPEDLPGALASCRETQNALVEAESVYHRASGGERLGAVDPKKAPGAVAEPAPALKAAPEEAFAKLPEIQLGIPPSAASAARTILYFDALSSIVLFAFSVMVGIALLWANNLTWGGPLDLIVALLWGFGIDLAASDKSLQALQKLIPGVPK